MEDLNLDSKFFLSQFDENFIRRLMNTDLVFSSRKETIDLGEPYGLADQADLREEPLQATVAINDHPFGERDIFEGKSYIILATEGKETRNLYEAYIDVKNKGYLGGKDIYMNFVSYYHGYPFRKNHPWANHRGMIANSFLDATLGLSPEDDKYDSKENHNLLLGDFRPDNQDSRRTGIEIHLCNSDIPDGANLRYMLLRERFSFVINPEYQNVRDRNFRKIRKHHGL